jgi:hypothetical protein
LLPEEPKGNTEDEYGQASNSCGSEGYDLRTDRSFELGGEATENRTASFVRCYKGGLPIKK